MAWTLCVGFLVSQAGAQSYTSIVVFGDSLSDVGNDAALSAAKYGPAAQVPGPATGYNNGRFTDGADTIPAARNYQGIWIEQLAAKLAAKPVVSSSLAGGADYAYGFATTNNGTTAFTYGPGNALSFTVNNMGLQVNTYLATNPKITSQTLFAVWGGANDLIAATSTSDILNAASREVALVQTLITAGATDFVIPNLPPLGLVPRFNGSPATSVPPTAAAQAFNQALAAGLAALPAANPGRTLHLYRLDTYQLFQAAVGPPIGYGLANVTASSQANPVVNPDTYLFWDDLHPTTYGHSLLAAAALTLLGPTVGTTTSVTSSSLTANLGSTVTFTATVSANSTTPIGTVTFLDGTTTLGTAQLSGTTTSATATLSTSQLTAGMHSVTASYTGVNGLGSSTSTAISELIVPPSFAATVAPTMLAMIRGGSANTTLTITPAGGYTGTFTMACGSLPAHMSCGFSPASLSIAGSSAVTSSLTVATSAAVSHNRAIPLSNPGSGPALAMLGLPLVSLLSFCGVRRRSRRPIPMLVALLVVSGAAVFGLSGCGNPYSNDTASGTYQVQVTVTPATGAATTLTLPVTVQ